MDTLKLQVAQLEQINKALALIKPANEIQKQQIAKEFQKNLDFILEVRFKISCLEAFRAARKAV